ncbi:MAG: nuclear transport factor 2 family protein [Pseudomonadota bacterium]|nr:nuclear transport factor 2 family protein [Pseudomonadota bacterium]
MVSVSPSFAASPAAAGVDRFVSFFEGMTAADLDRLGEVYADDVHFVDPFSDFRGRDHLRRVLEGMFRQMSGYALEVEDCVADGDAVWLRWTMRGHMRVLGREPWVVTGVSIVRFDADGRVAEHIDYWDSGSQFYQRLPLLGRIIARIRRKVAGH